ncbi:MAG: hypothetical protein QOF14_4664 [Hyphomicrobiales bacterium]|jgi:tetratricopeptide (TPR) repeat protein|nr:hypothetical protein [Hyphomicrobiales bacterium]
MATSVPKAMGATLGLLLLGFTFGPLPASAQTSEALVAFAKAVGDVGSSSEQSGKFDDALKFYSQVIMRAGEARNAPASDPTSTRQAYIVFAAGHIDTARVLFKKAAVRNPSEPITAYDYAVFGEATIKMHIYAAEEALKTAEALEQQFAEEIARKHEGMPLQGSLCCSYLDIIYAELGELHLLKGEAAQARSYYTAISERHDDVASNALVAVGHSKLRAMAIEVLRSDLAKKAGGAVAKELVGVWKGPLAGSLSGLAAETMIGFFQSRLKSNEAIPR